MRRTFTLFSVLALLLALGPPATAGGSTPIAMANQVPGPLIGLVTDGGALADMGFNEYAWEGVQAGAKAVHGSAEAVVPPANSEAYAWSIEWFVGRGFDVIVTVGFLMADATLTAAHANPDVQFIGLDQFVSDAGAPPNYQRLVFDEAESGFLAGMVAATMSTTGTIGAVGGMSTIGAVLGFINGYRNGAAWIDSDIDVRVTYAEDFGRPDLGADAAAGQVEQNADVIFAVAGGTNLGVFGVACGDGVWAVGVDFDQYLQAPAFQGCILTSAEKRLAKATSLAIQRFAADGLQAGESVNDASNGGIGLAPIRNAMTPKSLRDALGTALAGLADGSIDPCSPTACTTP